MKMTNQLKQYLRKRFRIRIFDRKLEEVTMEQLTAILDQSPSMVLMTDLDGSITYVNKKFLQVMGYAPEEIIGKNPRILKTGEQSKEIYNSLWATISAGREWRGEFCNKKKNGELLWELASISPVKNREDRISHYLAIKEDITARKIAEAELQKAKEAAESANLAKSEFLAKMSHEIRTPLNGIIGMTNLVLTLDLTPEQKENVEMIKTSADDLLKIVNDILDFTKIEAGKMELERLLFDIWRTVEETVDSFSLRANEKKVKLACRIDERIPRFLMGDPGRLRQVLVNLIGNALKFTQEGVVAVNVCLVKELRQGVILKFSVKDTGMGISKDKIKYLFKSFSQIDSSYTRKFGGTGLGLAISKQLVAMMSGEIGVESTEGLGSDFYFTAHFAATDGRMDIPAEGEEGGDGDNTDSIENISILLAEDNYVNQKVAMKMLQNMGWNVKLAVNGKEVLQRLQVETYDLILMDIQMPEMDGFETAVAIRRQEAISGKHLPIIAMTALALSGDRERCLREGMDDYLSKPILAEEVRAVVQKHIRRNPLHKQDKADGAMSGFSRLIRNLNGNRQLARELLDYFLMEYPVQLTNLRSFAAENNFSDLEKGAHKLKGSLLNFGYKPAVGLLQELETMARNRQSEGVMELLRLLEAELDKFKLTSEDKENFI